MKSNSEFVINGYFRKQAVTGQQRFAVEIADHLHTLLPAVRELAPSAWSERSRALQWIELQVRVPKHVGGDLLISLTGRAPVTARRHIVTVFDLFPITHPEWYTREFRFVHSRLLRHHFIHADGIIAISKPVQEAVLSLAEPNIPVVVAPCAPSKNTSVPEPNYPRETEFFLAVGSLEPRKNLGRLISAYGLLPAKTRSSTPLLIAGGGSDAGIFAKSGISDIEIPDGVRFLGRVTDSQLAALYRNATAFVSASMDEGFGLPLIEAAQIMSGVMVLSDIPIYRWVMDTTPAIFVDPMSVESIASGLVAALTSTTDIDSLRKLSSRFSWEASAHTVAELAKQVIA